MDGPGVVGGVVGLGILDMPIKSEADAVVEIGLVEVTGVVREGVDGGEFGFGPYFDCCEVILGEEGVSLFEVDDGEGVEIGIGECPPEVEIGVSGWLSQYEVGGRVGWFGVCGCVIFVMVEDEWCIEGVGFFEYGGECFFMCEGVSYRFDKRSEVERPIAESGGAAQVR